MKNNDHQQRSHLTLDKNSKVTVLSNARVSLQFHSVHRREVEGGWSYPLHEHPLFELNMVEEGTQIFTHEDQELVMSPKDIILIKPDAIHGCRTRPNQNMTYACIHFNVDDPGLRQALCKVKGPLHREGSPLWEAVYPVMTRIFKHRAKANSRETHSLEGLSLCLDLISALCRLLANPDADLLEEHLRYDRLASQIAGKINSLAADQSYMAGDISIKQSISQIAEELGYHPAYCTRVFKGMFGVSPRQYLSDVKLRESKLLLMDRGLSLDQISVRLGFRDASHFSKQFKRWTGYSPTQYRRMLRGRPDSEGDRAAHGVRV